MTEPTSYLVPTLDFDTDPTDAELMLANSVNERAQAAYLNSAAHGFWDEGAANRNKGEMLALIHSEVSEALEGLRKGLMDDHLPDRPMVECELADVVIRCLDMAGGFGWDLGGAIVAKMRFNAGRPHRHGKAF